jgi:hypothetical protein
MAELNATLNWGAPRHAQRSSTKTSKTHVPHIVRGRFPGVTGRNTNGRLCRGSLPGPAKSTDCTK